VNGANSPAHWTWGPPGPFFSFCTGVAIVMGLEANSRGAFVMSMLALAAWAVIALIWLIRFLGATWSTRLRLPATHWLRWLVIPVAMGLAFLWANTDGPSDLRFALSRDALNQAAAEVMAGGSTDRGWIGLYPVDHIERISNGMRFVISDAGFFDQVGLAYSTDGRPEGIDGMDEYEPLGGGWWRWIERFD